jgi:hypothetical protein
MAAQHQLRGVWLRLRRQNWTTLLPTQTLSRQWRNANCAASIIPTSHRGRLAHEALLLSCGRAAFPQVRATSPAFTGFLRKGVSWEREAQLPARELGGVASWRAASRAVDREPTTVLEPIAVRVSAPLTDRGHHGGPHADALVHEAGDAGRPPSTGAARAQSCRWSSQHAEPLAVEDRHASMSCEGRVSAGRESRDKAATRRPQAKLKGKTMERKRTAIWAYIEYLLRGQ